MPLTILSMAFFAVGTGDHALLYILTDNFDNELVFEGEDTLRFTLSHTFPSVNPHRSYNLRVYPVENDLVAIAKTYKGYVKDTTGIKTLRDKERENPEVAKIYGAAHFYLFDTMLLSEEDVNWPVFRESMDASVFNHIRSLSEEMEDAAEFLAVLESVSAQDYVDGYQRTVVIWGLSELLRMDAFWEDAAFPDASLYNEATVVDASGEYLPGFQGVGRKLNPTLAFPQVQNRVEEILANGAGLNSWLVDCDATGEVYNDYALNNPTTSQQDVAARLERMKWLGREKGMVVGSECGNDYAANAIVFAHGIELQSFAWMDEDMRSNRESEYYLGRYYAPGGGAAEKMTLQVPVKEEYRAHLPESRLQRALVQVGVQQCRCYQLPLGLAHAEDCGRGGKPPAV